MTTLDHISGQFSEFKTAVVADMRDIKTGMKAMDADIRALTNAITQLAHIEERISECKKDLDAVYDRMREVEKQSDHNKQRLGAMQWLLIFLFTSAVNAALKYLP